MLRFFWLAILGGCSVGPSYVSPPIEVSAEWKNGQLVSCEGKAEELVYLNDWWEVFEDPRLDALEARAVENNRDLFIALERIQEARALRGIAAADLYPQITLNPLFTNTDLLIQNYPPPNSGVATSAYRTQELYYFLPINLSYEVDLWGKIRDQVDATTYNFFAKQKDYEAVMLDLTASLAAFYYQLRAADSQLDLLIGVLKTRQKALEINRARYDERISNYADVTLAAQEVDSALGLYDEIKRQRELLVNEIAVLMGVPASELALEANPIAGLPPCIPAGIPSDILLRRPDIAEAEYIVQSDHALVKRAYSQFFPSLILTASAGYESPFLKYFLKGFSRYWMDGVGANQLIFDGGKTSSNVDLQISRFEQAGGAYQQQVLVAFREVEDALSNVASYKTQYEVAQDAVKWAETTWRLYLDRYTSGIIYYIDVADAERDLLNFQITLNSLQGLRFLSTIQFIKSLGGGWGEFDSLPKMEAGALRPSKI